MKVFHVINSYSRAGAELLVTQLLLAMPQGWEKHVCAIGLSSDGKDSEVIHLLEFAGVITHQLNKKVHRSRSTTVLHLRNILKEVKPDIIHTHCESPDFYGRLASIGLAAQCFRTIHNHNPWSKKPFDNSRLFYT